MTTDLTINQGADFSIGVDLTRDDATPVNLTGCTFLSSFRSSYSSANSAGNLTMTITNALSGNAMLSMNAAVSSNIGAGRYFYDVLMTDASNTKLRLLEGVLTIRPRVN